MATLLLALAGLAFLDSLDVLVVGVTTAVVFDSRLGRRSPLPGGMSFLAGVFAVTTAFGLCTVLGINFLTGVVDFRLTPTIRYWGELVVGVALIGLAVASMRQRAAPPAWTASIRRQPWLLGAAGVAIGVAQAPTAVPYLAALTMISARVPLPPLWPVIIMAYCALALAPPLLVLGLAMRGTIRARRVYRTIVRGFTRYGPLAVRTGFVLVGAVLMVDALAHYRALW